MEGNMNNNAKRWVAALRSGEFTQAKEKLEDRGSYCCLGVACVIAERNGNVRIERDANGIIGIILVEAQSKVLAWLNMQAFEENELGQKNDEGMTFLELADYIERNQEKIFERE
jgi:hypothetical protein